MTQAPANGRPDGGLRPDLYLHSRQDRGCERGHASPVMDNNGPIRVFRLPSDYKRPEAGIGRVGGKEALAFEEFQYMARLTALT